MFSTMFVNEGFAQKKYYPDHPEVEAMATKAVDFLQRQRSLKVGEATLCALAVVQHSKRYKQMVPADNQFVNGTIARILREFPANTDEDETGKSILTENELYYPALALILLAETDSKKYQPYIERMIKMFERRQKDNGAFTYLSKKNTSDTSQTQYVALALFVAKQHGFSFDPEIAGDTLDWLCNTQFEDATWRYILIDAPGSKRGTPDGASGQPTLSINAAAAGTMYLLADLLNLNRRVKSMSKELIKDTGLPRTVGPYIKPLISKENNKLDKAGPLVSFERGRISSAGQKTNGWLEKNFKTDIGVWNFYYLYAFERYAYFREQAEGDLGRGKLTTWYDQSIEMIQGLQNDEGQIYKGGRGESSAIATAFAVLVLVRSSEVLVLPISTSIMNGGLGFKEDVVLRKSQGSISSVEAEKDLSEMLDLLNDKDITQEQLQELAGALKKQIGEFRKRDSKSRGEIKAFLRSMVGASNYYRRLIAVRFLAGEQDMDNVPALLFALGDPDFRICLEAHNGLRLVSRKIDSLSLSDTTKKNALREYDAIDKQPDLKSRMRSEFSTVKRKWTQWFLKIRPGAELFD